MLALFRFRNIGPFRDETVFDMRAVKAYKEHPNNLIIEDDNHALLKVAAVYGANASGKSNFVYAYQTFRYIVKSSFSKNNKEDDDVLTKGFDHFIFDETSKDSDCEFEATYHYMNSEYRYGYIFNKTKIRYEWLYKSKLGSKRQTIVFERDEAEIKFGSTVKAFCEKYKADIDEDVLVLSFVSGLKLSSRVFVDTLNCITDILAISNNDDDLFNTMRNIYLKFDFNPKEKESLLGFLSAIDVGIKDISIKKSDKNIEIYTYHDGSNNKRYKVPIKIESDGTRKAIAIFAFIRTAITTNKALIIDELNAQLHPLLVKYLVDLFYGTETKAQLIYTTHDTTLLSKRYMRRDQIWFTSKNEAGIASLYSLAEFKVRNDSSYDKEYLGGTYGGIPILKDFDFGGTQNGE